MKNENERIGYNLREKVLRYCAKNDGVTQRDIAIKAKVHPVTLSRILHGEGTTYETIEKIASVVGANPSKIIEKGKRTPKYTAKTLEEIVSDVRVLRQYVGPTDRIGLELANKHLWYVVTELKKHRMKLQREQAYNV